MVRHLKLHTCPLDCHIVVLIIKSEANILEKRGDIESLVASLLFLDQRQKVFFCVTGLYYLIAY